MPARFLCLSLILMLAVVPAAWAQGPGGQPPAMVEAAPVIQRQVNTKVTLTGTAEAHRVMTLASEVEALVKAGLVEEGQAVEAGQVLVRLDDSRLRLKLAEAGALVKEAQANLKQMNRDLTRKQALHKTRSVPLKEMEDAHTSVERQEAMLLGAQHQVALLQNDLSDASIKAPTGGVVIKRLAWRGEWVKKGGPILELAVLDPIKVVVQVPERFLPPLKVGQEVAVSADALPDQEFKGRIQAIIPQGDIKSRAFPVQIRVENKSGSLKPGMLMRATLAVARPHQALLVPKDALVISQSGYSVVLIKDGKAHPVSVRAVAGHGNLMEVTGAIKPGQQVVVVGNERLFPGQPVQLAGSGPPAGAAKSKP